MADFSDIGALARELLRVLDDQPQQTERLRSLAQQIIERTEQREPADRSLKWRPLGTLAGGIAHDMNNALQTIVGALTTVEKLIELDHLERAPRFLEAALRSTQRGGELSRSLQRLARRKPDGSKPVEVNSLIVSMEDLFRRVAGERIAVQIRPAQIPAIVSCDPGELENVLLNLVINAVESIPDQGEITVATHPAPTSVGISISETEAPAFVGEFASRYGGSVLVAGKTVYIHLPSQ